MVGANSFALAINQIGCDILSLARRAAVYLVRSASAVRCQRRVPTSQVVSFADGDEVSSGSGSDRVSRSALPRSLKRYPVATAHGTDLILN